MRELETEEAQSVSGGNLIGAYYRLVVVPLAKAMNTPGAQQRALDFHKATRGDNIYGVYGAK